MTAFDTRTEQESSEGIWVEVAGEQPSCPLATVPGSATRFRIHDLRHTAAPVSKQATRPKVHQEIMGHASITTTLDLYGHLYPGEMDRYAARLDDAAG